MGSSERLFVIGGGNVGLITAYHAIQAGIKVVGLCEIADRCGGYKVHEDKIKRLGVKIFTRHTVLRVEGKESVERIIISEVDDKFVPIKGSEKVFEVDTVLVAAGLSPINELYNEAIKFGMLAFVCGDAEEIAEASAAMFSGKICAHKVLKELGFITKDVPKFWFEKLNILKSRPGKIVQNSSPKTNPNVYPVIHCRQEIPCNLISMNKEYKEICYDIFFECLNTNLRGEKNDESGKIGRVLEKIGKEGRGEGEKEEGGE
jgi:sarcosine oxidase subunit alpha